jgi:hypothetical protein
VPGFLRVCVSTYSPPMKFFHLSALTVAIEKCYCKRLLFAQAKSFRNMVSLASRLDRCRMLQNCSFNVS